MQKSLVIALTALSLGATAAPAVAQGLLGTVRSVVSGNVSNPRDKPEVQAEVDHADTSREERDYLDTSREERDHVDTSRAERDYADSFNR